jgi:hypothetical protein
MAWLDCTHERQPNTLAIQRAVDAGRHALAAFQREEPLPARTFPPHAELNDLAPIRPNGHDYTPLDVWLARHTGGL